MTPHRDAPVADERRWLGVDVGSVRIGVAISDPELTLATPWSTIKAAEGADLVALSDLVREHDIGQVIVGLPRSLSGDEGVAAATAREFARQLASLIAPVTVRLVDERFTSVDAQRQLRESGITGARQRTVVDQAAATLILQAAIDQVRVTGRVGGELVMGRKPRRRRGGA